jgi:hypothetical protein
MSMPKKLRWFHLRWRWVVLLVITAPWGLGSLVDLLRPSTTSQADPFDGEGALLPMMLIALVVLFVVGTIIEDLTTKKPPQQ